MIVTKVIPVGTRLSATTMLTLSFCNVTWVIVTQNIFLASVKQAACMPERVRDVGDQLAHIGGSDSLNDDASTRDTG